MPEPMDADPHPDSLFDRATLAAAYPDLLAVLARDHAAALAAAARTLEEGAAALRALNTGSSFTSPGAFMARAWIARIHPGDIEGVHEDRAREAASRLLNGTVERLQQRSAAGLVFAYVPAEHVADLSPPLVRVRPVEEGRRFSVELLDAGDGTAHAIGTPSPAAWRWPLAAGSVSEEEARETAGEALVSEGRVGALVETTGGAFHFAFAPYPGTIHHGADPRVLVTPLDNDHVRVQLGGATVCARVRVRR